MRWGLIVLFFVLLSGVIFFSFEHNRAPFSDSEGVIWKGQKFGIVIGQPDTFDRAKLRGEGWSYDHTESGGGCIRHRYSADYTLTVFVDDSWRHGTLCAISKGRRVRAAEWFYGPFWPEL